MINIAKRLLFLKSKVKVPTIGEVKENWNEFSHDYDTFDYGPQTFSYTFLNMLQLQTSSNILEVACGTGKLLPFMLQLKPPTIPYLASDLAPNMVQLAQNNLRKTFQQYQSRFSFEEWVQKMNLSFKVMNAEQPIEAVDLFDRIICNCALFITSDPKKMLKNLYAHAKPGCLFGVNVWGNKDRNNLMMNIRDSILQNGFELPQERSNFHLFNKVQQLAEETGWQVVVSWEQNAPFPVTEYSPDKNQELFQYQLLKLPKEQRQKVMISLQQKLKKTFADKKVLNFSVQMYILRKK